MQFRCFEFSRTRGELPPNGVQVACFVREVVLTFGPSAAQSTRCGALARTRTHGFDSPPTHRTSAVTVDSSEFRVHGRDRPRQTQSARIRDSGHRASPVALRIGSRTGKQDPAAKIKAHSHHRCQPANGSGHPTAEAFPALAVKDKCARRRHFDCVETALRRQAGSVEAAIPVSPPPRPYGPGGVVAGAFRALAAV